MHLQHTFALPIYFILLGHLNNTLYYFQFILHEHPALQLYIMLLSHISHISIVLYMFEQLSVEYQLSSKSSMMVFNYICILLLHYYCFLYLFKYFQSILGLVFSEFKLSLHQFYLELKCFYSCIIRQLFDHLQ